MKLKEQKLTHWTNKEFKGLTLNGKGQFRHRDRRLREKFEIKPIGFWVSVNNSWEDWLEGNWDSWLKDKVCLDVELSEDINLFIIKSKKQFLDKYEELIGKPYDKNRLLFDFHEFHLKLKEQYDGMMLLSKPFYEHRMDMGFMYFYGWDCESICVWNKDKIKFKEQKC